MKNSTAETQEIKKYDKPKGSWRSGIVSIRDPKWIFVLLCYIAAIALMGQDPWYGDKHFTYNQGIFVGILAILIVAGFCWETYLLGRPSGINLVLHCILILPIALLIGRIAGIPAAPEETYGFLGQFKQYIVSLKDMAGLESMIPDWIEDVFRNPGILFLIMFTSIAFTQKQSNRRFALIIVGFLIPAMQTLSHDPRPTLAFGIGFLALVAGVVTQYNRYENIISRQNVLTRLQTVDDSAEFKCSLRISNRAIEDGYVTEDGVMAVVHREYSKRFDLDALSLRGIGQAISYRLVREHRILELHGDERGFLLVPFQGIFRIDSLFDEIAVWIRKIILTGIVVIWLISPIDFFPDSIPILGAVDDAVITLIGAGQWLDTFRRRSLPVPKTP